MEAVKPELLCDDRAREILRILTHAPAPSPAAALAGKVFMQAGIDLLPPWAARMYGLDYSDARRRAVRSAAVHQARERMGLPVFP